MRKTKKPQEVEMTQMLSATSIEAIHTAMRHLARQDGLGRDETFTRTISQREAFTPTQAVHLRTILGRHVDKIPAEVLDAAMREEPHATPKRGPGRPLLGEEALTQTERTRAYRESADRVAVQMSAATALRLRNARLDRQITTDELVSMALDALERRV